MPTKVYCEHDCIRNHSKELTSLGNKAMIVTGRYSSKRNGSLEDLVEALDKENISWILFDDIEENPSIETVMRATSKGLDNQVEFVIGLGGGSPMDAAKAIAMMIANPDKNQDVLYKDIELVNLPLVTIPTTAGTGSEVTPWAVLTIHRKRTKKSISHQIFPNITLMDSRYLKMLGRHSLISTSVDTLAHLIESRLSTKADAFNSVFSEKGMRLWGEFKQNLLDDKMTDEDYDTMMEACMLGGIAIAHTNAGLPHALSYKMTYERGISHGIACGYTLGGFVKYYENEILQQKVLENLGFTNIEEFCGYLDKLIGKPNISEELWKDDVKEILNNSTKIATYPYYITNEIMEKYLEIEA